MSSTFKRIRVLCFGHDQEQCLLMRDQLHGLGINDVAVEETIEEAVKRLCDATYNFHAVFIIDSGLTETGLRTAVSRMRENSYLDHVKLAVISDKITAADPEEKGQREIALWKFLKEKKAYPIAKATFNQSRLLGTILNWRL